MSALQQSVLIGTSSSQTAGAGSLALHDISTGTNLATFKQSSVLPNCTSAVPTADGLGGLLLASQQDKAVLNVYSWQKDQLHQKVLLPQKLSCFAADGKGEWCAGGTSDGQIYLWEVASGILFASFDAHYRRVTKLAFTACGGALLSASEDASVAVWAMSRLLNEDLQGEIPTPYCTLSNHTLPVTDIAIGSSIFPNLRVLTSSLDNSVKVWDLNTRSLLTTFLFPAPIQSVSLDPYERALFAASAQTVHQVELFRRRGDSTTRREAVGGGGMGDIVSVSAEADEDSRAIPVKDPITAVSLSLSGSHLFVGTSTGFVHVYDLPSHQLLRTIQTYKGFSITHLTSLLRPADLVGHSTLSVLGATQASVPPIRPVGQFRKVPSLKEREEHVVPIKAALQPSLFDSFLRPLLSPHSAALPSATTSGAPTDTAKRVEELEAEVAQLREHLGRAQGVNDAMWAGMVELGLRGPSTDESAKRRRTEE